MISIEQINGEIAVLEEQPPTHVLMQKLAALYTVRDHIVIPQEKSQAAPVVVTNNTLQEYGISDFLQAITGKDTKSVMLQMDELMSTVQVLQPRLYESVMRKLKDL